MRSLGNMLMEIDSLSRKTDLPTSLETRGSNAFAAVRKLIQLIESNCDKDVSDDLIKRFFNAARTDDWRKFQRGVNKIRNSGEDEDGDEEPKRVL